MRKNRIFTTTKNTKKFPLSSVRSLPPFKILDTPLKWKVGASASVCHVTLCVYCWVHFMTIAKMYGNLFSGRRVKSCHGLDKKVLFTSLEKLHWTSAHYWQFVLPHLRHTRVADVACNNTNCRLYHVFGIAIYFLFGNCRRRLHTKQNVDKNA